MIIFAGLVAAIPNVANQIYLQQFQKCRRSMFIACKNGMWKFGLILQIFWHSYNLILLCVFLLKHLQGTFFFLLVFVGILTHPLCLYAVLFFSQCVFSNVFGGSLLFPLHHFFLFTLVDVLLTL